MWLAEPWGLCILKSRVRVVAHCAAAVQYMARLRTTITSELPLKSRKALMVAMAVVSEDHRTKAGLENTLHKRYCNLWKSKMQLFALFHLPCLSLPESPMALTTRGEQFCSLLLPVWHKCQYDAVRRAVADALMTTVKYLKELPCWKG